MRAAGIAVTGPAADDVDAAEDVVLDRQRRRQALPDRRGVGGDVVLAVGPRRLEKVLVGVAGEEVEHRLQAAEGEAAELEVGPLQVAGEAVRWRVDELELRVGAHEAEFGVRGRVPELVEARVADVGVLFAVEAGLARGLVAAEDVPLGDDVAADLVAGVGARDEQEAFAEGVAGAGVVDRGGLRGEVAAGVRLSRPGQQAGQRNDARRPKPS
jgi:hypothetical protein